MQEGDRKLAAIMFTDMVGYTALGQRDESLSLALVEEQRKVVRPILTRHYGNEVKTIGDAFLVVFPNAVDAVRCAYDIQRAIREFNLSISNEKRIHLRVGVHVGEVMESQGDVSGDAVNVASRIEPLAEDGGVCVTRQVYDLVRNKVDIPLASIGPKSLKNVSEALEVFKMVMPWGKETSEAPVQLERNRVAVLPFTNISHDQTDEYFADGVTEELITAISQVHDLKVIARTSTARYKGTSKSVAEIGRELKVGSVLEGSTRMAGNKVRVTAQLVDTSTEEHIWASNYDRQLDDIFSIQSEIARSVSEALKVQLLSGERRDLERRPTLSSSAFVKYLKGRAALHNRRTTDLLEAKKCFEEAIAEDENFAMAHVGLADAYFLLGEYFSIPIGEAAEKSKSHLDKALSLDPNLPEAHVGFANALQHEYKFDEAVQEYQFALSTNTNYAQGHHWFAVCLWDMGKDDQAFDEISKAEELDPLSVVIAFNAAFGNRRRGNVRMVEESVSKIRELDPGGYYADLTISFIAEEDSDYRTAAAHLERVVQDVPGELDSLARLGKLYGLLGETTKARDILSRLEQEQHHNDGQLAAVLGGLGEKDEMFRLMERAFEKRTLVFRTIHRDIREFGIKEDSRYRALLSRAGLA